MHVQKFLLPVQFLFEIIRRCRLSENFCGCAVFPLSFPSLPFPLSSSPLPLFPPLGTAPRLGVWCRPISDWNSASNESNFSACSRNNYCKMTNYTATTKYQTNAIIQKITHYKHFDSEHCKMDADFDGRSAST